MRLDNRECELLSLFVQPHLLRVGGIRQHGAQQMCCLQLDLGTPSRAQRLDNLDRSIVETLVRNRSETHKYTAHIVERMSPDMQFIRRKGACRRMQNELDGILGIHLET